MKNSILIQIFTRGISILAIAMFSLAAKAQVQVYSENFETDTTSNWIVNQGLGLNSAEFFFDYSTVGIPLAPHSTSSSTHGLRLEANIDPITQAGSVAGYGISVSPLGFGITENFEMHFDLWLNFVKSGNGSTQIGGAGYGTAGTAAQVAGVADSIFIGASTDGGNAADYRVYAPDRTISYQDADHVIRSDTNTPFVYAAGSRNNSASYYITNFSPSNLVFPASPVPSNQTNLFPRQTGAVAPAGTAGFKWHDASLKKVANIITYSIDGLLIATIDSRDATGNNHPLGGTNILFNFFDINGNASTDVDATNVLFALFDNVRITNFPNVVSVDAITADASETGPANGLFTITRTSAGVPLTVNYTLSGTASNGVDYVTLPGSVTFDATATTTNITVVPIDDSIPETTETVTLNINASPDYVGAGSATVRIRDNEPSQLTISAVNTQLYERTNDFAQFRITRLGDTNAAAFAVNVSFSGTATLDTDYTTNGLAMINPGDVATTFRVLPIVDSSVEGNETIICTLNATVDYTVNAANSATVTLVDATLPAETVLFSDDFNVDSSANWTRLFAALPDPTDDSLSLFAYDYGADGIPPAPHSTNDSLGLRLTVNKNDATAAAAALNFYPNGQSFSGNYALRFDMYLVNGAGTSSTEYALFGINHSGTKTNWLRYSSGGVTSGSFDGIFFDVEADGGGNGDYAMFSSPTVANNPTVLATTNAAPFAAVFKSPPWAVAGVAANFTNSTTPIWADVEVSLLNNMVTLKINNTVILQRSNTTSYASGNIMLGYDDAFDSIGPGGSTVIYDNVRVVRLTAVIRPIITSIQLINGGTQVQIDFTGGVSDSFSLVSSGDVAAVPYTATGATITSTGVGTYRAVTSVNGSTRFYQIKVN
ncbi:MAG: Calx-beta domain-containing protein [Verrucomicrobiota bacterium]